MNPRIKMAQARIIDTHTHLCDTIFDSDRQETLNNALKAGVVSVLSVSETLKDAKKNLSLAKQHPILRPLAGLYPAHLSTDRAEEMIAFIRQHQHAWIGIGEVGLDFWTVKEESNQDIQKTIFIRFIRLSTELNLPLNVHSRSAGRQVINLLLKYGANKVQLHAFDGKASTALKAVEAGYTFSIPPSILRSRQKQKLVKHLPLSCLLVETDSPVLGPVPGQRNEPKNILEAVNAIAEIKGLPSEKVTEATFHNTVQLYSNRILTG
jgi:TatD DNase family protein